MRNRNSRNSENKVEVSSSRFLTQRALKVSHSRNSFELRHKKLKLDKKKVGKTATTAVCKVGGIMKAQKSEKTISKSSVLTKEGGGGRGGRGGQYASKASIGVQK